MADWYKISKDNDRKKEVFSTASLIIRFNEGCHLDEIYKRSIDCYETLLDLIEKPEVGKEVSRLIKQPKEKIETIAKRIIHILLFNKKNNLFLSFGLTEDATPEEIRRRWKRLLMIYHPDRVFNQKGYEEIAKKINQVYREIGENKNKISYDYDRRGVEISNKKVIEKEVIYFPSYRHHHPKYLKYLPTFIIFVAIAVAIFTILLLFIKI
ncbi:MAG: J domain-containing protein [Thermodesulfovibrionales bacterium]